MTAGTEEGLGAPALALRDLSKSFDGVRVLEAVHLTVRSGEVVGLLGQNGSGKSTLVKILAGFHAPEPGGALEVGGRQVNLPLAPGQFRELGLGFIFQDLGLAPRLTVVENLTILERSRSVGVSGVHINWRRERKRAREILDSYKVSLDPAATVADLPAVGQALLAIVRAAEELRRYREKGGRGHGVLVLDEPTAFLPEAEEGFLFDLVRRIVAGGAGAIFISHDLAAVRAVADRVTVLKDGRVSGEARMADVGDQDLVELITGRPAGTTNGGFEDVDAHTVAAPSGRGVLVADGLRAGQVRDVTLTLHEGEVVGLAGLLGSGVEDIPYLLFGARRVEDGALTVAGRSLRLGQLSPARAMAAGLALVPGDRGRDGLVGSGSVAENLLLLMVGTYYRRGRLGRGAMRRAALEQVRSFGVVPSDPSLDAAVLSGGNQQKVVVAKWLSIAPRVLLLHEPTQGVDVGARSELYTLIRQVAEEGKAALWVSTDFAELAAVCDRVLVVAGGRVVDDLRPPGLSRDAISAAVYGHSARADASGPTLEGSRG